MNKLTIFCLISTLILILNQQTYADNPMLYHYFASDTKTFLPSDPKLIVGIPSPNKDIIFIIPDCVSGCLTNQKMNHKWIDLARVLSNERTAVVFVSWLYHTQHTRSEIEIMVWLSECFYYDMSKLFQSNEKYKVHFILHGLSVNLINSFISPKAQKPVSVDIVVDAVCLPQAVIPFDVNKIAAFHTVIKTGASECLGIAETVEYLINNLSARRDSTMSPLVRQPRLRRHSSPDLRSQAFKKNNIITGSKSQYDSEFQISCIAIACISIAMSSRTDLMKWDSKLIDQILTIGNNYYKDSLGDKPETFLNLDELNSQFTIEDCVYTRINKEGNTEDGDFHLKFTKEYSHFTLDSTVAAIVRYFDEESVSDSALFSANLYTVAIFRRKPTVTGNYVYFLFDSHKRNKLGLRSDNKPTAILVEFPTVTDLAQNLILNLGGTREWDGTNDWTKMISVSPLILKKICTNGTTLRRNSKRVKGPRGKSPNDS